MNDVFTDIYLKKEWQQIIGTFSGPGASLECSSSYLDFLQNFIKDNNIKSILDIGCGDFNLMQHLNFENLIYKGVDIVQFLVNENNKKYSKSNIKFEHKDLTTQKETEIYDLILIKDVFQHLSFKNIFLILENIKGKNILISNDYYKNYNLDIDDGGWRYVDVSYQPFNLKGDYIFQWPVLSTTKKVFHYKNE
jgi:hypothetical protein